MPPAPRPSAASPSAPRLPILQLLTSILCAAAATLVALAAFYVRGDLGAVFRYLAARGDARRLAAAGADAGTLAAAKHRVHLLADAAAYPDLALKLWPVALLLDLLTGSMVWVFFGSRAGRAEASDVQERMLLRLAYRLGGRFTLGDVAAASPLNEAQAIHAVRRLREAGRLRDLSGGVYEVVR